MEACGFVVGSPYLSGIPTSVTSAAIARIGKRFGSPMFESRHQLKLLLVEDNPADVLLTQEALKEGRFEHQLSTVVDGEQALSFLRRSGKFSEAPRPDVILLDLNLPKKDGRELLSEIKKDPSLKHIPVIVLTTSEADQDVCNAYQLHANCYLTKPLEVNEFIRKIRSLEEFWLQVVRLPNH